MLESQLTKRRKYEIVFSKSETPRRKVLVKRVWMTAGAANWAQKRGAMLKRFNVKKIKVLCTNKIHS